MSSKKLWEIILKTEWKLFTIIVIGFIVFLLLSEIPVNSFERAIWSINRDAYHVIHDIPYSHDFFWRVEVPDNTSEFFDYAFCFLIDYPPHPSELQGVSQKMVPGSITDISNSYTPIYMPPKIILLSSEFYRIEDDYHSYCKYSIPKGIWRGDVLLGVAVVVGVFGVYLFDQYIKTKLPANF